MGKSGWKLLLLWLAPPIIWLAGVVIYSGWSYDGICPGLMDIQPYTCSLWEFIGRNTFSPFALAAHIGLCGGWLLFSGVGIGIFLLIRALARRNK
jgi:hypothetical protein